MVSNTSLYYYILYIYIHTVGTIDTKILYLICIIIRDGLKDECVVHIEKILKLPIHKSLNLSVIDNIR